jgi:preprotein translocase subunit SecY
MTGMNEDQLNGEKEKRPLTNSRKIRQENDRQFLKMVVFTLVVVGGLIIALIYGPASLLTSLPILLGGAALIAVPYLVLKGIEWLLKRYNGED